MWPLGLFWVPCGKVSDRALSGLGFTAELMATLKNIQVILHFLGF